MPADSDFRMLLLDLDGTTLTEDRALAPVDVEAAHALRDAGVHVTIATGRLFPGTQWVAKELGIDAPVAVLNGNELIHASTAQTVSGHYVEASVRRQARQILYDHGLQAFLFGSRGIHLGAAAVAHAPYLQIWSPDLHHHDDVFDVTHWNEADDIVAVCAVGDDDAVASAAAALEEHLPQGIGSVAFDTYTGERFLHVSGTVWDKGTALKQLAQDRGLRPEQVVAVGDWWNDEPMIASAGRGYAMAHATDELKHIADEVLDASRNGGAIAEVARRVWGIR